MRNVRSGLAAVAVLAAVSLGGVSMGRAQNLGATSVVQQHFRIEAQPAQTNKKGQPVVRGYVYNVSPYGVANVRLGAEALDANGAVTGPAGTGWVNGDIPVYGRRFFELPVSQTAPSYRITVLSFDVRLMDSSR